jgi:sugar/nucleoside kinase (ribokinase family)
VDAFRVASVEFTGAGDAFIGSVLTDLAALTPLPLGEGRARAIA